jgi:hypothetical protein
VPESADRKQESVSPECESDPASADHEQQRVHSILLARHGTHTPTPDQYADAKKTEWKKFQRLKTFTKVPRSSIGNKKVVKSKWVLTTKMLGLLSPEKTELRARLCARGFSQVAGVDFAKDSISAPTVRAESLRETCAEAATDGDGLYVADVEAAFLNAKLEEIVYMEIPPECREDGKDEVLLLHKAVYGLKQAGNKWYKELRSCLTEGGYTQTRSDPCVWIRKFEDGSTSKVAVHVDDFLVRCRTRAHFDHLLTTLRSRYTVDDRGPAKMICGISIETNTDGFTLHQTPYTDAILKKFGFDQAKPTALPSVQDESRYHTQGKLTGLTRFPIQMIVGTLLWLSLMTRPDIAYAVARLAQHVKNPTDVAYKKAARILRFLKGTRMRGIRYRKGFVDQLKAWVDADFAGDKLDRKSQTGWIFMKAGGPVAWRSVKQTLVTLSSTEAEWVAAVDCGRTAAWFTNYLEECGRPLDLPLILAEDNGSTIAIGDRGTLNSQRTKHIDLRFHWLLDKITSGKVKFVKVATKENIADPFTKSLPSYQFYRLTDRFMYSPDSYTRFYSSP